MDVHADAERGESMTTTIRLNGKKISRKKAEELFGKDRVERRINEAIEAYMEDPWEISSWMDGMEVVVSA